MPDGMTPLGAISGVNAHVAGPCAGNDGGLIAMHFGEVDDSQARCVLTPAEA